MVTWIPSIYPLYVSIYTSTMDPSWVIGILAQPTSIDGIELWVKTRMGQKVKTSTSCRCAVGLWDEKITVRDVDHPPLLDNLPSGKHTKSYGKSSCFMGKSTINGHFQ
jgi:hypothetical protein